MKIEKIVIYTTFPDLKSAKHIINGLVKEKLAACGNIFQLQSIFTWQGKIEEESEYGAFYKKVEQYIKDNHPYEVPEIISWGIQNGLDAYLDWVEKETAD